MIQLGATRKPSLIPSGYRSLRGRQLVPATLGFVAAIILPANSADIMKPATFAEYALSANLNADQTYMVESMIDMARINFDESYWDDSSEQIDERRKPDYKPRFKKEHVTPSARELGKLDWMSFQNVNGERPVRDIGALRFYPAVQGLAFGENEIADISALEGHLELRRLHLKRNHIRDLSPLVGCSKLELLEIGGNPVEDLSVLGKLPSLKQLQISADQLPVFRKAGVLPHLVELDISFIDSKPLESFLEFPAMPKLSSLRGVSTKSLSGLEKFPSLRNLVNLSGNFDSLEPLAALPVLARINILSTKVTDLAALSQLAGLKAVWINTTAATLDLSPLGALPGLREVSVKCKDRDHPGLAGLRKGLKTWDADFFSQTPRHIPSLKLEVLDEKAFAALDHQPPHGTRNPDGDLGLLSSELQWLDGKLAAVFARRFEEDEDYHIPHQWQECRWRDVQLLGDRTKPALASIIGGIQTVLSHCKNDWIIYLQVEEGEFELWIYPDKVVVARKHAKAIEKLLKGR